jgi:chromate transport protein ChrA
VDGGGLDAPPVTTEPSNPPGELQSSHRIIPPSNQFILLTWKVGAYIIMGFLCSFVTVMIVRGLLKTPPRGVSLFANLYLAGAITLGGGPVVTPLLCEYIVAEGWVSSRDFLIGLALIQSFPGPNFATAGSCLPSFVGALIGFLGIFTLGICIVIGVMGLWNVLRSRRWLLSLLRGINAGAVGLVFTAVYKLWQIGFVDVDNQSGSPLGRDPWWVGIAWYGVVKT